MATVTSLTEAKIQELMAGWEGVALSQDEINSLVAQLRTDQDILATDMTEFNEVTLPQLRADLAAGSIRVSELNDATIPNLQQSLDAHELDLTNLKTVDIPSLNDRLNSNSDWIIEFDEVTIPNLDARLATLEAGGGVDTSAIEARLGTLEGKFPIAAEDILADTITANEIAADTITANEIAARTITAMEIAADTITANEIESRTITALEIAADTITANEIAGRTITALEIAADTITANEIAADTITANEIAAGAVTALEIAAGTITGSEIAAGAITAENLAANTITSNEIAADAITSEKLAATAVTATHLAGKYISGVTLDIVDSIYAEPGYLDVKANLMEAKSAIFHDNVTRRGLNNYIPGRETASTGVTNPGTPPTVTNVWPYVQLSSGGVSSSFPVDKVRGMHVNEATNEIAIHGNLHYINIYDKTTGVHKRSIVNNGYLVTGLAMCRVGGWYYTLYLDFMSSDIKMRRYAASGEGTSTEGVLDSTFNDIFIMSDMLPASDQAIAISEVVGRTDTICIMWITPAGQYRFRNWNIATKTWSTDSVILPGTAPGATTTLAGLNVNVYVGTTYRIQPGQKPLAQFYEMVSSPSLDSLSQRALPYGEILAGAYSKYTLDTKGRFFSHNAQTEGGEKRDFTYTWYDSDPGGTGTAESLPSPMRSVAIARGAWANIKTPLPPDDGSVDGADTVKAYINNFLQGGPYTTAELAAGRTIDQIATSGSGAPVTSGFATRPATLPGGYQSTAGDNAGPIWSIYGDGVGRMGPYKWAGDGKPLNHGAYVTTTTTPEPPANQFVTRLGWVARNTTNAAPNGISYSNGEFTITQSGIWLLAAALTIRGSATAAGRRITVIYVNGSGAFRAEGVVVAAGQDVTPMALGMLYLNAGDVISIRGWHNSSTTVPWGPLPEQNFFSAMCLAAF